MNIVIRAAQDSDRPSLVAMNAALQEVERALRPSRLLGAAMSAAYWQRTEALVAEAGARAWVAEADGTLLGFLVGMPEEDPLEAEAPEYRIRDAYVVPEARGRGVLRALMAEAEAEARRQGIRRLVVTALTANEGALAAYARLGFGPGFTVVQRWLPDR
jgi:GNAT superfamily N-acetyltransferase